MAQKNNIKSLIELYAEQHGISTEAAEVEMRQHFGGNGTKPILPEPESGIDFLNTLKETQKQMQGFDKSLGSGKEDDTAEFREMRKMMLQLKMMELMMAPKTPIPETKVIDIDAILAKNNAMWEQKAAQEKADRRFDQLQSNLDNLARMIAEKDSTSKKPDPLLELIKKDADLMRKELTDEKAQRQRDLLATKEKEFNSYKEYMDNRIASLEKRETPKSTSEVIKEEAERLKNYESLMKEYAKAHGWSNEKLNTELEEGRSGWMRIISEATGENGILQKALQVYGQSKGVTEAQPEIAQPEVTQAATTMTCGNCHGVSTNGTDWCDACRIQYSNDVVSAQQKAQAVAQKKQEEADTAARAKGEIPPAETQPEEQ